MKIELAMDKYCGELKQEELQMKMREDLFQLFQKNLKFLVKKRRFFLDRISAPPIFALPIKQ